MWINMRYSGVDEQNGVGLDFIHTINLKQMKF